MAIDPIDPSAQVPGPGEFCYSGTCTKQATSYLQVTVDSIPELHPRCDDHVATPYQWGEPLSKIGVPNG